MINEVLTKVPRPWSAEILSVLTDSSGIIVCPYDKNKLKPLS